MYTHTLHNHFNQIVWINPFLNAVHSRKPVYRYIKFVLCVWACVPHSVIYYSFAFVFVHFFLAIHWHHKKKGTKCKCKLKKTKTNDTKLTQAEKRLWHMRRAQLLNIFFSFQVQDDNWKVIANALLTHWVPINFQHIQNILRTYASFKAGA